MTILVIDASVALKWVIPEELSDVARQIVLMPGPLVAPRLNMTELANALARKVMQGSVTIETALIHLESISVLLPVLFDVEDMIHAAFYNACSSRHPIYDMIYLETARRLDAQLITADRRFAAKLAGTDLAPHVTLLSDWRPE